MKTRWTVSYLDFDGVVKTTEADVHEPREGEFYATGVLGCSKTFSSVTHWKPIKAALQSLVSVDRPVQSYSEIK